MLEEANQLETELILKDKTYDRNYGYNLDFGGDNHLLLEETKQKISKKAKEIECMENSIYQTNGMMSNKDDYTIAL